MNHDKAAKAQSRQFPADLRDAVLRIKPVATWTQLSVSQQTLSNLKNICSDFTPGKSCMCLFSGDRGTDKYIAIEVLANELQLDIYKVGLSKLESKYIGETEKNIQRLFDAAQDVGAMLFFDEADALFGKRSGMADSHDRYANIETNYLLQRMEAYSGISILATNRKCNLEPTDLRRFRYEVEFVG